MRVLFKLLGDGPGSLISKTTAEPFSRKLQSFITQNSTFYRMNKCKFISAGLFSFLGLSAFSHCISLEMIFHTSFHQSPTCFCELRQYSHTFSLLTFDFEDERFWGASRNLQEKLWIIARVSLEVCGKTVVPGVRVEKHLLLRRRAAFWSLLWHLGVDVVGSSQTHPRRALPLSQRSLYVPALNLLPFHLKPQMGHLRMVSRFFSSSAKTSRIRSANAAWAAACSNSSCPFLLVQISPTMNS